MEKFWNLLHYFVYKMHYKATYCFYKYTGAFKLYDIPFVRKRFKNKFNIDDPQGYLMQWWGDKSVGGSSIAAFIFFNLAFMPPALPLMLFYMHLYIKTFGEPDTPLPGFLVMLGWGAIISVLSYRYLMRKDKYLKYFRLFDMQSHKWKVKWGGISAGILIIPLLITILTIKFANL